MFRFASPWMLLLLPLVLGAVWQMARRRRRGDARLQLPAASIKLRLGSRRRLPMVFFPASSSP